MNVYDDYLGVEVVGVGQWSEGVADERQHCRQHISLLFKSEVYQFICS